MMAAALKLFAGIQIVFIWGLFAIFVLVPTPETDRAARATFGPGFRPLYNTIAFLIALTISAPAIALYAFAQIVADVRWLRQYFQGDRLERGASQAAPVREPRF